MASLKEFSQQQNTQQNQATETSGLSDFMSKVKGWLSFSDKKEDDKKEIKVDIDKTKFEFGTKPPQMQTSKTGTQSLSEFSQGKAKKEKEKSTLGSAWQWTSKQISKPIGVSAKTFRGTGEVIGSLMAIASPRVSAEKGFKAAAESFVRAQKGVWDVLRGEEETDFLREMAKAGIKTNKLDRILGIGANIMLDPLWIAKPVKAVKGIAKLTKLDKPIKAGAKAIKEIPKVKQLKSLFTTTTGNKEFDSIVKGFRALKESREGGFIDDAVKLQKDIKIFKKSGIKNGEELIVEGLENRASLFKAVPKAIKGVEKVGEKVAGKIPQVDPRIIKEVDKLRGTYSGLLERAKEVGLKVGDIKEYAPRIVTKESFATKIKKEFGLGAREFGKGAIETKTQAFLEFTGKSGKKIQGTAKGLKLKNYDYLDNAGKITKEYKPGFRINSFVDKTGEVFKITGRETQKKIRLIKGGKYADLYEKSPAIQLAVKGQMYAKAITSQEFAGAVKKFALKEGGVAVKHSALKGIKFLPEQAKVIDNYYQTIKPEELKVIIRGFDKVQNLWKAQALVSPSYHIRNEVGNLWNNFIAGVNPWAYAKATKMQAMPILKKYVDKAGFVKISNKMDNYVKSVAKEINEMKKLGVIDQGWYAKDIGEEVLQRVEGIGKWKSGINPLHQQNYLFQLNKKTGSAIENNARIAHYLSKRASGLSPEKAAESVKKFLFDYGDLTSFEKNIMKRVFPFYCVPISHEILTKSGWKKYDKLKKGESVLTSTIKGMLEWQRLEDVAVFDYDGVLKKFERKCGKFLFTNDHRWLTETTKTTIKNKEYGGTRQIKRTYELNTSDIIPLTGKYTNKKHLLSPRLIAILGWVVTDGYFRWRGNHCEMVIYQHPKKFLKDVEILTGTKRRKPHPQSGVCAVPVALKDIKKINTIFKDKKDLPKIITKLSNEEIDLMYLAMMRAEGYCTQRIKNGYISKQKGFSQDPIKNKYVADAFQILLFLRGMIGNISQKGINLKTTRYLKVSGGIKEEYYKGKIWCPKTKNGTWIMRNGGSMIITGNTWTKKNLPIQLEGLITQPAKYALPHKIIKEIESGVEVPNEKYMSSYITENIPVRMRTNKEGNTEYFLLANWLPYASAIDVLSQPLDTVLQMATPLLKTPIEMWANQSMFWRNTLGEYQEIERKRGTPYGEFGLPFVGSTLMRKKNIQLLRNVRILNDINKWIDKQDPTKTKNEWTVKLMETLVGRAGTYDVGKSKYFYDMDTRNRINELEQAIKDAKKKRYTEKAKKLRSELIEFQQMRR